MKVPAVHEVPLRKLHPPFDPSAIAVPRQDIAHMSLVTQLFGDTQQIPRRGFRDFYLFAVNYWRILVDDLWRKTSRSGRRISWYVIRRVGPRPSASRFSE
jgi:hypothetical protein